METDTSQVRETVKRAERQARKMEDVTTRGIARIPSSIFFWSAVASVGISAFLRLIGRKDDAVFVGEWPPTLMAAAIFTKLNEERRR